MSVRWVRVCIVRWSWQYYIVLTKLTFITQAHDEKRFLLYLKKCVKDIVKNCEGSKVLPYLQTNKLACHISWMLAEDTKLLGHKGLYYSWHSRQQDVGFVLATLAPQIPRGQCRQSGWILHGQCVHVTAEKAWVKGTQILYNGTASEPASTLLQRKT